MMPPLPEIVRDRIERIRLDNTSGAVALARQAAEALILAGRVGDRRCVEEAARRLVAAQPAMAPILNLANTALLAGEGGDWPAALAGVCTKFVARLEAAGERISQRTAQLIEDGGVVLTHSYSETVRDALVSAARAGKRFEVICTESRPVLEGAAFARNLGAAELKVSLIIDAAVHARMGGVSLVAVGADSVSPEGVVNKTGTSLVALSARAHAVAFYVLCGTGKFLPSDYPLPPEPPRPAGEITPEPSPNVSVENFYFELTPLDLVTGIITEDGIFTPPQLRRRLKPAGIHPALRRTRR